MIQLYQQTINAFNTPVTLKVYEGVGGVGSRGTWGMRGGPRSGAGIDTDGRNAGHGGGGDGGSGGDLAEDEVRAAERLDISVREVTIRSMSFI